MTRCTAFRAAKHTSNNNIKLDLLKVGGGGGAQAVIKNNDNVCSH